MKAPLARVALVGLALTFVLAAVSALARVLPQPWSGMGWNDGHREMALDAALLGGLLWLVAASLDLVGRPLRGTELVGAALLTGAILRTIGAILEPSNLFFALWIVALLPLIAGAWVFLKSIRSAVPRGATLVDVARDPLTKGDDACVGHLRFGAMMLLAGLLAQLLAALVGIASGWRWDLSGWALAADHLLLVGFGLPTLFGLSHIWVPRLSGVPAIAAGAIKGELHSTRLGLLLLVLGFGFRVKGLVIAGGLVVFFAAFVFMGVLGANIMKNKSKTQRVTPGFAYIPWIFSGVLWVVVGVLLGLFLNVVRADVFAARLPALRLVHSHLLLFGGALQLGLGFAARAVTATPVPFAIHKWSFYALNVALALLTWGALAGSPNLLAESAGLALVGLAAWFFPLVRHARAVKG